jgi:hypothetical protein
MIALLSLIHKDPDGRPRHPLDASSSLVALFRNGGETVTTVNLTS